MSFDIALRKTLGDCTLEVTIQSSSLLVAIIGPSGIGKTTLLNCIAGLVEPDSGHITIGGRTLFDITDGTNVPVHRRGCGYVFQDSRLFPHKDVKANLIYGLKCAATSETLEVAELLDIFHLLDRFPSTLSGGETRRVAIGRALSSSPRYLLLDEPTASLDPNRAEQVLSAIERLRDELAIPILYVSHDRAEVARLTDAVITMD